MDIVIESLLEGSRRASGKVAIIDVFRAFTTAAVVLANGASKIIMVGSAEEALELREAGTGSYCIGEIDGRPLPGFDFGNSPFDVSTVDFRGKTIIQRTSAGTQGIISASGATQLYASALVTASATARALMVGGGRVTLVAMGYNADSRTDEDELCALHLRNLMEGRPGNIEAMQQFIRASGPASSFGNPDLPHFKPGDLEIALDVDRYDFAIRVQQEDGRLVARMYAS
jgi:2-phosphosulfolactate phosphatase